MSDTASITDGISAVCSAIAGAIGFVTVITVYVAARQLLTEHRTYQMGLSEETLGLWHKRIKTKELLGMQQRISTPVITLPTLVKKQWKPNVGCTINAHAQPDATFCDQEKAPAKASWVNFVEALGLGPEDDGFYYMSTQANLVNGVIPMRWAGKDLVGICTMLSYQSCEEKPSFKNPMPLPMQLVRPHGMASVPPQPGRLRRRVSKEGHHRQPAVARAPRFLRERGPEARAPLPAGPAVAVHQRYEIAGRQSPLSIWAASTERISGGASKTHSSSWRTRWASSGVF